MPDLILSNATELAIRPHADLIVSERNIITLTETPPAGSSIVVYNTTGTWSAVVTSQEAGTYFVSAAAGRTAATSSTLISSTTSTRWTTSTSTSSTGFYFTTDGLNWTVPVVHNHPSVPRKPKRGPLIKKSIRSSIKRALSLMANFGMEEDVRVFLGGNEIEVSHPDSIFKFVISKEYHGLIDRTEHPGYSTPYQLSLYTKTNVHVADLCVYMDKTPMLDQILALSMFIKTGNEDKLLEKANFRSLCSSIEFRTQLALGNPMLQKKLRVDAVAIH